MVAYERFVSAGETCVGFGRLAVSGVPSRMLLTTDDCVTSTWAATTMDSPQVQPLHKPQSSAHVLDQENACLRGRCVMFGKVLSKAWNKVT